VNETLEFPVLFFHEKRDPTTFIAQTHSCCRPEDAPPSGEGRSGFPSTHKKREGGIDNGSQGPAASVVIAAFAKGEKKKKREMGESLLNKKKREISTSFAGGLVTREPVFEGEREGGLPFPEKRVLLSGGTLRAPVVARWW